MLWDRWQNEEGLKPIEQEPGKPLSCIFSDLKPKGGIRTPDGHCLGLVLTLAEREEISRRLVAERLMPGKDEAIHTALSTVGSKLDGFLSSTFLDSGKGDHESAIGSPI